MKVWKLILIFGLFFQESHSARPRETDSKSRAKTTASAGGSFQEVFPSYKKCGASSSGNRGSLGNHKGYMDGMLLTFMRTVCRGNDRITEVLGKKSSGRAYSAPMTASESRTSAKNVSGIISSYLTLLHLGLRESDGKCGEGRDRSAGNTSAWTQEAGLFQTSFNVYGAMSKEAVIAIRNLEAQYKKATPEQCFAPVFQRCQGLGKQAVGSDILRQTALGTNQYPQTNSTQARMDAQSFMRITRGCPAFAAEYAAITSVYNRRHYGPLNTGVSKPFEGCRPLLTEISNFVLSARGEQFCEQLGSNGNQQMVINFMKQPAPDRVPASSIAQAELTRE